MDSSDEELFEVTPSSSIASTDTVSHSATNLQAKVKDVSICLVRLSQASIPTNISAIKEQGKKSRKLPKLSHWKYGIIRKKSNKKKANNVSETKNSQTSLNKTVNKVESPSKTALTTSSSKTTLLGNHADNYVYSSKQNEKTVSSSNSSQNYQSEQTSILSSSSAGFETADSQASSLNDTFIIHTSARTLPYDWSTRKTLASNKPDAIMRSNTPFPSSSLSESAEQPSCSYVSNEKLHQNETKRKESHQDEAKEEKLHQNEVRRKESHQDEAEKGELHQDRANREEFHQDEARREEFDQDELRRTNFSPEEARKHDFCNKNSGKYDKRLNDLLVRAASIRGQLAKWEMKKKRKISSDESSDDFPVSIKKRRRYAVITSDISDDEETITNKNVTEDDSRSCSRSSYETVDRERLRIMNIRKELRVTLARLEYSDDVDIVKWRESRAKNVPSSSTPSRQAEEQRSTVTAVSDEQPSTSRTSPRDIESLATSQSHGSTVDNTHEEDSNIELILLDDDDSSTATDDCQASSKSPKNFDARSKKHNMTQLNIGLKSLINLWKKYKLFRKPRVLLIRLETLCSSSNNSTYSAREIENLTRHYIRSVINTSSMSFKSPLFKLVESEIQENAGTSIAEENDAVASAAEVSNVEYQVSRDSSSEGMTLLILFLLFTIVHKQTRNSGII